MPTAYAQQQVDLCQQVTIVGDSNWPPYAFVSKQKNQANKTHKTHKTDQIQGIGIELVEKIFKELDIPVKIVDYADKRRIMHGLRLGDIGIIVALYNREELKDAVDIIQPGYILDPLTVVVRKGYSGNIKKWEDLIGQRGIVTNNFAFEDDFSNYSQRYLYIQSKGNLDSVLKEIVARRADYLIGSKEQLIYGINKHELSKDLELLSAVTVSSEVHMGFSKQSACYVYYPYLRQRLVEYKNSGLVRELIANYDKKLQKELDFDFLFDDN